MEQLGCISWHLQSRLSMVDVLRFDKQKLVKQNRGKVTRAHSKRTFRNSPLLEEQNKTKKAKLVQQENGREHIRWSFRNLPITATLRIFCSVPSPTSAASVGASATADQRQDSLTRPAVSTPNRPALLAWGATKALHEATNNRLRTDWTNFILPLSNRFQHEKSEEARKNLRPSSSQRCRQRTQMWWKNRFGGSQQRHRHSTFEETATYVGARPSEMRSTGRRTLTWNSIYGLSGKVCEFLLESSFGGVCFDCEQRSKPFLLQRIWTIRLWTQCLRDCLFWWRESLPLLPMAVAMVVAAVFPAATKPRLVLAWSLTSLTPNDTTTLLSSSISSFLASPSWCRPYPCWRFLAICAIRGLHMLWRHWETRTRNLHCHQQNTPVWVLNLIKACINNKMASTCSKHKTMSKSVLNRISTVWCKLMVGMLLGNRKPSPTQSPSRIPLSTN